MYEGDGVVLTGRPNRAAILASLFEARILAREPDVVDKDPDANKYIILIFLGASCDVAAAQRSSEKCV
jgi:hypothetical protein